MTLIQIYYSAIFIWEKFENNQIQLNTDLFTVSIQIMWDSLICTITLFFAISIECSSYEYDMNSMVFFALISFSINNLIFYWKRRYKEWLFNNIFLWRKKYFNLIKYFMVD